tara:strand:+ start:14192 stop:14446 length:255 start_codon:yes stop_codon:yes gene_type:complete
LAILGKGKEYGIMEDVKSCLLVITNPGSAQPGELVASLGRLDEALKDPKLQLHPRLRHFLENRSYEKALLWLDDGVPEKGVCGA